MGGVYWSRSVRSLSPPILHRRLVSSSRSLVTVPPPKLTQIHSDYAAKVFGFQTFGKVYGLIICLAGLFNFLQSPLDALTHVKFNLNPVPVNVMLMSIAVVVGASLVIFTWLKSRNMKREQLEDEA